MTGSVGMFAYPVTLAFLKEGGLLLNDVRVAPEELRSELRQPERHGIKLYCIETEPERRKPNRRSRATISMSLWRR